MATTTSSTNISSTTVQAPGAPTASTADRPFSLRGFASLLITLVVLMALISGFVLYVAPRGRVANMTGWSALALTRDQWVAVHINTSLLFIVVAVLHLAMNLSRLWGYLKRRGRPGINMKAELASAMAVACAIFLGTIWSLPPINVPVEFKYRARDYMEQRIQSAASQQLSWDRSRRLPGGRSAESATPLSHNPSTINRSLETFSNDTRPDSDSSGTHVARTKSPAAEIELIDPSLIDQTDSAIHATATTVSQQMIAERELTTENLRWDLTDRRCLLPADRTRMRDGDSITV